MFGGSNPQEKKIHVYLFSPSLVKLRARKRENLYGSRRASGVPDPVHDKALSYESEDTTLNFEIMGRPESQGGDYKCNGKTNIQKK